MIKNLENAEYFFKFFERKEYATQFINEGYLYINNGDYFRRLEGTKELGRYDQNEGVLISESDNARVFWSDDNGNPLSMGKITNMGFASQYCIYCLFTAIKEDIIKKDGEDSVTIDNRILDEFGKYIVMIKAQEFINRIKQSFNENQYLFGLVEYKDLDNYAKFQFIMKGYERMLVKDPIYSYQKEARIIFVAPKNDQPLKIKIGSLINIAQIKMRENNYR